MTDRAYRDGDDGKPEDRRKKLMMKMREWGFTDEERHQAATYMLRRDVTTFSGLDDEQVTCLLWAIEGFEIFVEIFRQRAQTGSSDSP